MSPHPCFFVLFFWPTWSEQSCSQLTVEDPGRQSTAPPGPVSPDFHTAVETDALQTLLREGDPPEVGREDDSGALSLALPVITQPILSRCSQDRLLPHVRWLSEPPGLGPGLQLWRPRGERAWGRESHRSPWVVAQAKSTGQIRAELWLQRDISLQDTLLSLEGRYKGQWDVTGRQETLQPVSCSWWPAGILRAWRRVLAVLGGQPSSDDRGGYYSGELAWSFLGARYDPIRLSGSLYSWRPRMGRPRVDAVCLVNAAAFPRAGLYPHSSSPPPQPACAGPCRLSKKKWSFCI